MKKKQFVQLGVTLGLVAAVGVGGTLAALTAKSETVTNTFSVGLGLKDGDIILNEAPVELEDGNYVVKDEAESSRVWNNVYDSLQPSITLAKDPRVAFTTPTGNCYMFIKVDNLDELEAKGVTLTERSWGEKWQKISFSDDGETISNVTYSTPEVQNRDGYYVYVYNSGEENTETTVGDDKLCIPSTVSTSATSATPAVLDDIFDGLEVSDEFDMSSFEEDDIEVTIQACAVQFDSTDLVSAFSAAKEKLG